VASDKRSSEANSNGSQTTLIYQDYNSSSLDSNGGLINAFAASRAAVQSNAHQVEPGTDDHRLVTTSKDEFHQNSTINSIIPMFPQASTSTANKLKRYESTVSTDPEYMLNNGHSGGEDFNWDTEPITDSGQIYPYTPIAERALQRVRPASIMPPERVSNELRPADSLAYMDGRSNRIDVQAVIESPPKMRTFSIDSEGYSGKLLHNFVIAILGMI